MRQIDYTPRVSVVTESNTTSMTKGFQLLILPFLAFAMFLAMSCFNGYSQSAIAINSKLPKAQVPRFNFAVNQLCSTMWSAETGLPYNQVPGVNLGATSFAIMDSTSVAYLCNSSSEIYITDMKTGKVNKKFPVDLAPRDFTYASGIFYVLNDFKINSYGRDGKFLATTNFSRSIEAVVGITRVNNSTFLLLPNGNSLQIEANENLVGGKEAEGSPTASGNSFVLSFNGDNFKVEVITADGKRYSKAYKSDKKIAGIFFIGATGNRIFVDVESYLSECPIKVERRILSIALSGEGIEGIMAEIKVPDVYYVLTIKDFLVSDSGTLYNMITAPEGAFVFELKESKLRTKASTDYPDFIRKQTYHFNDHLIDPEEK